MRRVLALLLATAAVAALPLDSQAQSQSSRRGQSPNEQQQANGGASRQPRIAPLRNRNRAGPCPFVKVLYEGARYVELTGPAAVANVGFTGEIEGVNADCAYQGDEPIRVDIDMLFNLGRGPQAQDGQHTYRYWVAVTERNKAVLAKDYFDLPVNFDGQRTAAVHEQRTIVIPRADQSVSGGNFEILVGFEVTPDMAEFNRTGSRFRANAGVAQQAPAPSE